MAKKILTQAAYDTDNIQSQPDQVKGQPTALKLAFDQTGIDAKTYTNTTQLAELQSETPNDAGANAIGAEGTFGTDNVGDELKAVKDALDGVVLGQIPDGSLTDVKLSNADGQIKDTVSKNTSYISGNARDIARLELAVRKNGIVSGQYVNKYFESPEVRTTDSIGLIDFGKVYASVVNTGTNTLVVDTLQVDKDGNTPTLLSDCFELKEEITLADASGENLIISGIDDGTKTLTFTTNIVGTYSSGANVYRSNMVVNGEAWNFGGVGEGVLGFDIENASYDSVSFSVAPQDSLPSGLEFNNDSSKMYFIGQNTDTIFQCSLSTPSDLSTASYDSVNLDVSPQTTGTQAFTFNSDGSKLYVLDGTTNIIYQYSLSTPFDLSTASYDSVNFSVNAQSTGTRGISLNSDDTKMYVVGIITDTIYQYTLSTPSDLSTASYDSISFSVSTESTAPMGLTFNNVESKLYVLGRDNTTIYQYSLPNPLDISTASYDSVSFGVGTEESSPQDLSFNSDGTKLYVTGLTGKVFQYTTGINDNTEVLSIDIRINMNQSDPITSVFSYLRTKEQAGLVIGAEASIVASASDESYNAMTLDDTIDLGDDTEYSHVIAEPINQKVTVKYTITRALTTDVIEINDFVGFVGV